MSQPPEEERAHGRITMKTYYKYFTTERGHLFTLLMVVTFILAEVREHSLVLCTWINHNLLPCVQYAQIHGYAFGCILYACAYDQNCPFILIWSNIFTKRVHAAHSSTLYNARVVLLDLLICTESAIPKFVSPGFFFFEKQETD